MRFSCKYTVNIDSEWFTEVKILSDIFQNSRGNIFENNIGDYFSYYFAKIVHTITNIYVYPHIQSLLNAFYSYL